MHKILVPKLNNNDERCTLLEWLCQDGSTIKENECIAVLETSKATNDFESPYSGILQHFAQIGDECEFGSCIAYIFADEQ